MEYYFKSSALHSLRSFPKEIQIKIIKKLDYLTALPNPLKLAESLKDKSLEGYRLRIGDYRVIFDLEKDLIIILKIGHRKDIYKNKILYYEKRQFITKTKISQKNKTR